MKILVINAGSSSIKYRLFDMGKNIVLAHGLVEKIGENFGRIVHEQLPAKQGNKRVVREHPIVDHSAGLAEIVELLSDAKWGVIQDKSEISAVGHRVVHGGEAFQEPTLITAATIDAVRENIPLAPLHNPANLIGIEVAQTIFPKAPQIAVFDTAFHQTIPPIAYRYALPEELYTKLHVRRYGFHGTSHQYVARKASEFLGHPEGANLITLHLGNGASMSAIEMGKSVDTTMGMTPLEGLIMGTRCGDVDPALHLFLSKHMGKTLEEIDKMMNKQSGLKGLCGANDMREIQKNREQGDLQAKLAMEMYAYRIKKYIGAYFAVLGKLHALVFTAGIGEKSAQIRKMSCQGLEHLGIILNMQKNQETKEEICEIQRQDSAIKILVIPTDEELEIARQSMGVLQREFHS